MRNSSFVSPDEIRTMFSRAMSETHHREAPQYGALIRLAGDVNPGVLEADPALEARLRETDPLDRVSEKRHGAIRLETPAELRTVRRLFAVMGMLPVG